jgi:hypothetical protein
LLLEPDLPAESAASVALAERVRSSVDLVVPAPVKVGHDAAETGSTLMRDIGVADDPLLRQFIAKVVEDRRAARARAIDEADARVALVMDEREHGASVPLLRHIVGAAVGAAYFSELSWESLSNRLLTQVMAHFFERFGDDFGEVDLSNVPSFNARCIVLQARQAQLLQIRRHVVHNMVFAKVTPAIKKKNARRDSRRSQRGAMRHPWVEFARERFGVEAFGNFRALAISVTGCELFYLMLHVRTRFILLNFACNRSAADKMLRAWLPPILSLQP